VSDKVVDRRWETGKIERGVLKPCVKAGDEDVDEDLAGREGVTGFTEGGVELGPPGEALGVGTSEEVCKVFDVVFAEWARRGAAFVVSMGGFGCWHDVVA
jgi:hypothetical protein